MRKASNSQRWRLVSTMWERNNYGMSGKESCKLIETDTEMSGWGFFSEEIGWFLCDFFSTRLTTEQKLIFYSYYITGMTLDEIGERFHCSHQAIHVKVQKINELLRHTWQYVDRWREDERN